MKLLCVAALVLALYVAGSESQSTESWEVCSPPEPCADFPRAQCRLVCWDGSDGNKECAKQHFDFVDGELVRVLCGEPLK